MLIDAHAHLDQYGSSWPEVLEETRDLDILTLAVSMDPPSYERTRGLCADEPLLIPAFGVHPWRAPGWETRLAELDRYVDEAPALGEAGLDFHFVEDEGAYSPQREVFEYFLDASPRTGSSPRRTTPVAGSGWKECPAGPRSSPGSWIGSPRSGVWPASAWRRSWLPIPAGWLDSGSRRELVAFYRCRETTSTARVRYLNPWKTTGQSVQTANAERSRVAPTPQVMASARMST